MTALHITHAVPRAVTFELSIVYDKVSLMFSTAEPRRMKWIFAAAVTIPVLVCSTATADELATTSAESPAAVRAAFSLSDTAGVTRSHQEWQGKKAVVLLFLATECPVSNFYAPEFSRIAKSYADRGVLIYGIHSDPDVSAADAAQHAREYGLKFPVLLDPQQTLAAAVGAKKTPEAIVLSPEGRVIYRGRIDDRYSVSGKRRDEPTRRELEAAIDAALAGKMPEVRESQVFGCPLPTRRLKTQDINK
jgi:peroxiredoxin